MSTTAKTDIAVAKAHIEELRMRGGEFTADSLERLVDAYQDLDERGRSTGADWVPSLHQDPEHLIPPARTIIEQMRNMGVSFNELRKRTGIGEERLEGVIGSVAAMTASDAAKIGEALDLDPAFLLRMDFSFQLGWLKRLQANETLQRPFGGVAGYADEICEGVKPWDNAVGDGLEGA